MRRKNDRHRPGVAVLLHGSVVAIGIERPLLDVLHLVGAAVEPGDVAEVGAGVNDVRIARVDGNVAALASAHGVPVGIATASDRGYIDRADWDAVGGGESGYVAVDPVG